jgi:hypothetical protein
MERAHKMTRGVAPFDEAGGALCERTGSTHVGICREMGLLDGAPVDVVVMEKLL